MSDLDSIEARAQRMLDGMTVNSEAFARDVLRLCNATRRLQAAVAKPGAKPAGDPDFADLFGGIFGGRRHG